jgi:hypothetical protein
MNNAWLSFESVWLLLCWQPCNRGAGLLMVLLLQPHALAGSPGVVLVAPVGLQA